MHACVSLLRLPQDWVEQANYELSELEAIKIRPVWLPSLDNTTSEKRIQKAMYMHDTDIDDWYQPATEVSQVFHFIPPDWQTSLLFIQKRIGLNL